MPHRPADWIGLDEALERILGGVAPLPAERVELADALGRVLAETVVSPIDQPPWDNSAMDGFAARAADVRGASRAAPVRLELVDDIPAGGFPARPVGPGQAAKIMTGAPVSEGADSVIRIEHTDAWTGDQRTGAATAPAAGAYVTVFQDGDADRNIRRKGEDLRAGDPVLPAGRLLRPAEIGVLAAVGRTGVRVHRRPRVAILSNGDELVEPDRLDAVLAGRKIVNSNAYGLAAAVRATGCEPVLLGIAGDDRESLAAHLGAAAGLDALITTAGASVGEHDLMKQVLAEMGLELEFWRVRIRPGSPFSFGRLPATGSHGRMPVFGLPGNPVSALVTYEVLVRPALRRMLGRTAVHTPRIPVRAAEAIPSKPGLVHFLRVTLEPEAGAWIARLTGPQGSGILTSMTEADALLIVPEHADGVPAGGDALAIPLWPPDPASAAAATFEDATEERS